MALVLRDRVREVTTTNGTGAITLAGAVTGYQSFSAIGNANTTYYCIASRSNGEWEVGIGTYTASGTTLSRDTILASSNSDSAVNFSTGTKDVFVVYPAGRSVYDGGAFNGTVGATTPAAGSFTTLNATGGGALTGTWSNLGSVTTVDINGGTIDATAIGGTTPAAGSFTTLSSTGNALFGGPADNGQRLAVLGGANGMVADFVNTTTDGAYINITQSGVQNWAVGQPAGVDALVFNRGRNTVAAGAEFMRLDSTGLAVTGALSATGVVSSTSTSQFLAATAASAADKYATISNNNGTLEFGVTAAGLPFFNSVASDDLYFGIGGPAIATVSSTGLAVTGLVSAANFYTPATAGTIGEPGGGNAVIVYGSTGVGPDVNKVLVNAGGLTAVGTFSSTGLAVTGALSCSTNLTVTGGTITTGSTTALSLATSGGTQFRVFNTASAVNFIEATGSVTGNSPSLTSVGSDANLSLNFASKGTGGFGFYTAAGSSGQVLINHTASANRYITLTGSNGGNPTIGTSAGDLAFSSNLRILAGSAAAPSIEFVGYTDVGFFADANGVNIGYGGSGSVFQIDGTRLKTAVWIEGQETAAPAAPAANGYRIYAEDNGAGKTRLMVIFQSGAAQQIAIEP